MIESWIVHSIFSRGVGTDGAEFLFHNPAGSQIISGNCVLVEEFCPVTRQSEKEKRQISRSIG